VKTFWPPSQAAQADYEQLRSAVVARCPLAGAVAARFEAEGLWGLIHKPTTPAVFAARLVAASRPPWTPYSDPRLDLLADAYDLLLNQQTSLGIRQETGT
jgi:hypothetical protein